MEITRPPGPVLTFALFALSAASLAATETIVTFAVTEERVISSPDGKTPPRNESRHYTQTVALGADSLAVQDDRQKTVYDFAQRRLLILESGPVTYNDLSLYHIPSFLEYELSHRNAMGAGMRAAKIENMGDLFSRFANETALRVESHRAPPDSPAPVIETNRQAEVLEFRHAGAVVARFIPADSALSAGERHRFVNYLAYTCNLHPQIRRAIADTGAIPRELVFKWDSVNTQTTTTLKLVSCAPAGVDSSILPAGARPAGHPGDPFYAILSDVERTARDPVRPGREAVIRFADEAVGAKRPLDAIMALLEFGLQSGEQLTDDMRRHREIFNRDPACQAYLGAFGQADKTTVEKNLAVNAAIDRRGLAKAHMLDLQRANLLEQTGQPREAVELYFKVLEANPYHAGALHDLGLLYARGFEPAKAWLCWDAARRLYPAHPMMQDITRIEQDLVRNEPDFF
jgi:tetratricopeptide (TPR) repeat protein